MLFTKWTWTALFLGIYNYLNELQFLPPEYLNQLVYIPDLLGMSLLSFLLMEIFILKSLHHCSSTVLSCAKDSGELDIRMMSSAKSRMLTSSPVSRRTPTPVVLILALSSTMYMMKRMLLKLQPWCRPQFLVLFTSTLAWICRWYIIKEIIAC